MGILKCFCVVVGVVRCSEGEWETSSASPMLAVVADLEAGEGNGLILTLVDDVLGESLQEPWVLPLVDGAKDRGRSPATGVHWNRGRRKRF